MHQTDPVDVVRQDDEQFGKRLANARTKAKMSQRSLAEKLAEEGVSLDPSAITRMEKGVRAVRLAEVRLLAKVLSVRVVDLLGIEGDPQQDLENYRAIANEGLQQARRNARIFIRHTLAARRVLEENPTLVAELGHSEGDDPPATPADYLPWVLARLKSFAANASIGSDARDEDLAIIDNLTAAITQNLFDRIDLIVDDEVREALEADEADAKQAVLKWVTLLVGRLDDSEASSPSFRLVLTDLAKVLSALEASDSDFENVLHYVQRVHTGLALGIPVSMAQEDLRRLASGLSGRGIDGWSADEIRLAAAWLVEFGSNFEGPEELSRVTDACHTVALVARQIARMPDSQKLSRSLTLLHNLTLKLDAFYEDEKLAPEESELVQVLEHARAELNIS